uniref:Uncharacterized protein n=1 Tax=Periophthalmus magnuspinnatus TaxID=409849 RepID=A0A3B3ZQ86_9GOBI
DKNETRNFNAAYYRSITSILTKLESAYLFEDSKHSFRYTSAFLIKNPALEEKYNACREKRREQGYSDKDLKETYGFLLFDQLNKAKSIGETGMLAENGTCTTLGDPTKGVYLSMYSDCLDPNCWYHGKSGYIVIVKITEGRVKKVSENYTHNLTKPTVGFDCHVSEQLQSVSSKTSSFLAFERTQYYLYELLDNGSTALSPSLACPYAVVAFSYTDNTLGAQIFNIGIRSTAGALAWAKLPSIIKVEWVISMLILRKLLPKAIFETTFNGQGTIKLLTKYFQIMLFKILPTCFCDSLLEHVFCCQCEIVTLNLEEKDRLAPLLLEIKKQDIKIYCISSFTDTKIQRMKQSLSSDALRVLPLLIYAEGEIEKTSIKPEEDLCDIVVQHMQSYATLISPSFPLSPFREVDIFPDQYDVLDAHQHLYSTPEWTDTQWQSLKSYLSNASSFQLPVCKASEILLVGQEARQEDLEDDIYICLSSPEEPSTSLISTGSEDRLDQKCSSATEASQDSMQPVSAISQLLVPSVLPTQERTSEMFDSTVYTDKGDVSIETKEVPLRTVEHSEELIVSITSAARTVDDEILDVIKHDQLSVTAKIQQATLNTFSEIVQSKVTLNCSDDNIFLTESDKLPQGHNLESPETPSLQMVKTLLKKDESMCSDDVPTQKLSLHEDRCEIQRNEHESDQLSKNTQSLEKTVSISLTDNALLKELETCALRKKSERWGLKPVVSTCGSIFIPYGSVETEEIRFLQEKLQLEKTVVSSEVSKSLDINAGHISDSSGAKEMFVTKDGSPYKPQSLSSPKGTRLKMLKKNQNLSADQVKKKCKYGWLHFQTPACYAEKQFQECLSDNSVSKIIQEKTNTSSEALNLLADLALCANKGQVSPHRTQECEFQANVTSPEQQTVLHALLSQPDAKSVQPQEPPSPDGFGGTGLVDAIYKEHAYSLPSSSSLPLALPAPFQVSPLNGSSRLLHALRLWGEAQQMPPLSLEDKVEENKRAPGDPKRSWYRRKFRLSRTIENRDKTVHVTRHWKEDYDFNLDSRFTVDPKDKTIVRALHGPWDSSIHDTNEEIQIIVHMWIGLFYSRSTARFFHLDPDVTFPAPENNVFDGVKVSNEKRPEQNASNIAVHSPLLNVADKPEVQVLDLSKPKNCAIDTEPLLFIPVWNRITKQSICTNDTQTPSMASAESGESHQTEDTCENFPKRPEVPIRRQDSCKRQRKKTQRNAYLSASPNKKESPENKMHAKNLSDSNTSTDRRPTNGDVNAIRSNNLLEIKKKYMEKLKAASSQVNQKIDSSAPQNDTEVGQCILLKKLLREEKPTIAVTPKLQALSKKTVVYKNAAKTCDENGWINPKTNETICNINLNGHTSLNIIGVDPLVESKNLKTSHSQEISVRKQDVMVENPSIDCRGLSQDEYVKTIKSPVINTDSISYEHPNDETENSKNCDVNSCTGINTSLEDKSLEQTCNEVDNQGFEDMEFVPSESSEVMVQLSTNSDNASYDGHSQHRKLFAAGSEVNHPSDLRDSETDDRCPTPTIDEQPFVYLSQSKTNSDVNELDEVCPDADKREPSTSLTPVMDKTLVELVPKAFNCDPITNVGTQSDIELRTLRTLKCLDEYLSTLQNKTHQSLLNSEDTPNSPICLKKRRSALIHNPNDMKSTSSMSDSCRPEVKYESSQYISPFNEANMQQVKQMCPTESLCVPDLFPTDDSGRLTKSNVNVEEGGLKSNQSSSSTSPGVAERPSKIVKEQGHFISPNKLKANPDCEAQSKPFIRFSIKRIRQGGFVCHGPVFEAHQNEKCSENFASRKCKHPDKQELQTIQAEAISSSISAQPVESHASPVLQVLKHDPYIMVKDNKSGDEDFLNYSTSFVDSKTNKITDHSLGIQGSLSCTVSNTGRKLSSFLEKVSKRCMQDDPTQSSMDRECLIFMDQMKQLLKRKQDQGAQCDQSNQSSSCPITVQFSHLQEQDDVLDDTVIPSAFINQKISVDMSDRKLLKDPTQQISLKPQAHGALEQPGVSAITAQCTRLYRDIMNKICSGSRNASLLRDLHKNDFEDSTANSSNYFDFCSQMKREMDDHFHTSLNSVVKKSCKTKNRFFLLITSDDAFFNKTQAYLEAEGHIAVQPSDFFIRESSSSPLLVIVRNEDIAGHIFEVPHLLELRKSLVVQFAGIDEPDDVVNLTYQELFIKGGFVMFDKGAVENLDILGDMKKILEILQKLSQTGKWKWVLHYRDSRRLKENARLYPKAKEKTDLLNKCKEDGLLDILPYHECDLVSRQEPNYLQCLCHQQVQNISFRYPVFVTDSETDGVFEKNGILTMTVNSFLMGLLSKTIYGFT